MKNQLKPDENIVIISFAGREKFLEVQKKYIFDLFQKYVNIELHLWNFSRNSKDNAYLQKLQLSNLNIRIFNHYYEGDNSITNCSKKVGVICNCTKCRVGKWTEPYKYYANNSLYSNTTFVKLDDDIVFLETKNFRKILDLAKFHQEYIISGNVINNGLCSITNNNLVEKIRSAEIIKDLSTPRDWWNLCTSVDFFNLSHDYFFENHLSLLNAPNENILLPKCRFSINTIAFTWPIMKKISQIIGEESSMNDEEIISNNFEIIECKNFVSCHLHFSDQRSQITDSKENSVLRKYENFADKYLNYR